MAKKISLNIPDDTHKELTSLSDFYEQNVENTIANILRAIGMRAHSIKTLSKEYKVPVKPETVVNHILDVGFGIVYSVVNKILENLEVKGLYATDDFGFELDEHDLWFHYYRLEGCNLQVDDFSIHLDPGRITLSTYSYIDFEKVSSEALVKLKKLVDKVEEPEGFQDAENYDIEIQDEEEFACMLIINLWAESLDYLPTVNKISEFVEKIFKEAGIE